MHKLNSTKRLLSLALIFLSVTGISASGQNLIYPPSLASRPRTVTQQKKISVDEDFLKAAELAIAERDKFKSQSEAKDEVIAAKDAQINALKGLLDIQKLISSEWQTAAGARKSALTIDDKLIAKYDTEI